MKIDRKKLLKDLQSMCESALNDKAEAIKNKDYLYAFECDSQAFAFRHIVETLPETNSEVRRKERTRACPRCHGNHIEGRTHKGVAVICCLCKGTGRVRIAPPNQGIA